MLARNLIAAMAMAAGLAGAVQAQEAKEGPQVAPAKAHAKAAEQARIDVVFVLDTTGSMSGLIEGAKAKIWSIANSQEK